jgi:5-methylcytosine-specific restriction endonuclease McrA
MQRIVVLDTNKQPLMPCHPARARKLLAAGKAAVYRRYPFTIILKYAVDEPKTQSVAVKLDPGSKTTGISVVAQFGRGWVVLWAANLHHRGQQVKRNLDRRRAVRRSRRNRQTRYRAPRFNNRTRPDGWLAPSLKSRVDNVFHWTRKMVGLAPVSRIEIETMRFDIHQLVNPEVSGVEYQQGELFGYEVREYLLEKWGRKCAYCGVRNVPLEIEHLVPKARGGSNRVSNLTLSCRSCNQTKGTQTAAEFGYPELQAQAHQPLKDAAAVNSIRYAIGDRLKALGLPVGFWSGGRTKYNRTRQGYEKDHWVDATCVGESGVAVHIPADLRPLSIKAMGRGSRQMCRVDEYGFPRTSPKSRKRVRGFQTGDMVRAIAPTPATGSKRGGKKAGTHVGRVAIRSTGSFRVGTTDGISWKYCSLVQRADGYEYYQGLLPTPSMGRPAIPHRP